MRIIVLFLFSFSLFGCATFKYVDEYDPIIYGKPKKIEKATYKIKTTNEDSFTKELAYKTICLYDKKGRETESFSYNSEEELTMKSVVNYNKKKRKIEFVYFNDKDEIIINQTFEFDNKYRKVSFISYNREKLSGRKEFKYINETDFYSYDYDKNDSLKYIGLVTFNKDKKINKIISYNPDKTLKSTIEILFDSKGNKIETKRYNSEHKLTTDSKIVAYDSNNNTLRSEKYIPNSSVPVSISEFKYLYDEYNNIIYKELYTDRGLSWIEETKYTYYK